VFRQEIAMSKNEDLIPFFNPQGVAVVGASANPEKVGHALFRNLLFGHCRDGAQSRDHGFKGKVYGVNRKGGEILGEKIFESLDAIEGPLDLILVAIPPRFIPDLLDDAAKKKVKNAIIISAGFAEMGEEGKALQDTMLARAQKNGMRLVGPNCLGVIRPSTQLNASFADSSPNAGTIGLLSQSGALITGVIRYAEQERFGLSAAVSLGAKADVEDEDILRYFLDDDETKAVALYVEAFTEPRAFFDVAKELSAKKPVVALKGGATAAGAKAASSHTGSLAGSHAAYSAAFSQTGILEAEGIGDFIHWTRALSTQPPLEGKRVAIITNAGGPGVVTADTAHRLGLEIAELSEETLKALDEVLPRVWSRNNPVDVIGDATPARYRDALKILGQAPEVDGIVLIMTVQAMTDPMATAQAIAEAHAGHDWEKPLLCSFLGLVGSEVGSFLDARGIPEYNVPDDAISSMAALMRRGEWLRKEKATPQKLENHPAPNLDGARTIAAEAKNAGQINLDLAFATGVLRAAGLRYNKSDVAQDADDAVKKAEAIGYPVVIKALSPDVVHKSDVGAIALNLHDAAAVKEACAKIESRVKAAIPDARIEGFTVEEMVMGTEIIVGMSRDPSFGPLMMVGMGGIFVEVYKDVSFGLLPLSREDSLAMIDGIKAQALLDGARGRPKLDRGELAEILVRIGNLVEAVPDIEELDLNPLVITEKGLVAIDARVILRGEGEGKSSGGHH
jgi:acetyltransferase